MAASYHVALLGKKRYGQIDGLEYSIWPYLLSADGPLSFTFATGLGFPADLDIKDPAAYPEVPELQGTVLDRSGSDGVQRVYSEGAPEVLDRNEITIAILAPSAEDSHTNVTLQTRSPDVANWAMLFFANGTQDGASAIVQLMRGPAASTMPTAQVPQRILPYASEAFGVYQPLIGWRSALTNERLADATANRFRAAVRVSGRLASAAQNPANLATAVGKPTDRTETAVGAAFAALLGTTPIIATAGGEQAALLDGWIETTSLIAGVVAPPAGAAPRRRANSAKRAAPPKPAATVSPAPANDVAASGPVAVSRTGRTRRCLAAVRTHAHGVGSFGRVSGVVQRKASRQDGLSLADRDPASLPRVLFRAGKLPWAARRARLVEPRGHGRAD